MFNVTNFYDFRLEVSVGLWTNWTDLATGSLHLLRVGSTASAGSGCEQSFQDLHLALDCHAGAMPDVK